jgi:hypothetical protein
LALSLLTVTFRFLLFYQLAIFIVRPPAIISPVNPTEGQYYNDRVIYIIFLSPPLQTGL